MPNKSALLAVHVTPRSGRDEVVGVRTDDAGTEEVCVRVTAPPDGGKANKAVCKVLAAQLKIPKSSVAVVSGTTARKKRISLAIDPEALNAWVRSLPPK